MAGVYVDATKINHIFKGEEVVVITGCAGFIGSHLCDFFVQCNCKVIGIDNLCTGSLQNIEHLFKYKNFEFYHHDVTKFIHIPGRVDYILHFASPASPEDYTKMPIHTMKVGALGTLNTLGLAKEKKSIFLLASTSEVYGDPTISPQHEKYWGNVNCTGIRGVYDEAKRFAEALTLAYHRVHNLNVKIARIFNTYGPRMRLNDGRVIPNFISQSLNNSPITIYGDGSQTRSFCFITDLIYGIVKLLTSNYNLPVNLGNPNEEKIINVAKIIKELTNSSSPLTFKPLPPDDPKQRCPDISLAKQLLNWEPKIPLLQGLQITINYFKEKMKNNTPQTPPKQPPSHL